MKALMPSFVLFMLLLTACSAVNLDAPIGANPLVHPSLVVADEIILQATERPSSTMTPTRVSTPTINYYETLGVLTMAAVATQEIEQQRDKTATVSQGYSNGTATATVAIGRAKDTATASYWATLDQRSARTQAAADTATVQAPITQKAQTDADFEPYFQLVILGGLVLILLLVLWFGWQVGRQLVMWAYEKRLEVRSDLPVPAPPVPAEPIKVQIDQRDQYGWGSVDWFTLPIDVKTLHEVAELLTTGQRYTQAQMTGAGKPLVKDASFNTFGDWMVKCWIANKIDGRYVISHLDFFEQVLKQR